MENELSGPSQKKVFVTSKLCRLKKLTPSEPVSYTHLDVYKRQELTT